MCNKKFRKFLDPLHKNSIGRRNPRLCKVAAIHLIPNSHTLSIKQVEAIFGLPIRQISDFGLLDGKNSKDALRKVVDSPPDLSVFQHEHLHSSVLLSDEGSKLGDENFARSNHERLSKAWEVYGGNATAAESIFDHKNMLP